MTDKNIKIEIELGAMLGLIVGQLISVLFTTEEEPASKTVSGAEAFDRIVGDADKVTAFKVNSDGAVSGFGLIDKADIDNLCIAPNRFMPDTKLVATGVKVQISIAGIDTILLADYFSDGSISISEEAVREAYKHLSR